VNFLVSHVEWWLFVVVFASAVLSVLQVASLLSFFGILVIFMEPAAIVPIATIFFLAMNITKMRMFRAAIDWKLTRTLVLASIPGVLIGSVLLAYLPSGHVRRAICALVILFLLAELLKIKVLELKLKRGALVGVGFGYGVLSGFLGSGSIVRTPFLLTLNLSKEAFIGTAAAASLFSNIVKLGTYWATGLVTAYVLVNGVLSIVVGVAGAVVGRLVVNRVSDELFLRVVKVSLLVSAVIGLIS